MVSQKQITNQAIQVKKYMKVHHLYFIRNNERYRKKLGMNRKQLYYAIQYLNKIGFLEPRNRKIYQILNSKSTN
jgi:hypothetical protein